jgi:excinuclease UvrABC helicase subunit UvrB
MTSASLGKRITVYPQTHYVTPKSKILNMLDDIKDELKVRRKELLSAKSHPLALIKPWWLRGAFAQFVR